MSLEHAETAKALLSDSFEVEACQEAGIAEVVPSDAFKVRHLRFTLQQSSLPYVVLRKVILMSRRVRQHSCHSNGNVACGWKTK